MKTMINLLPISFRRQQLARRRAIQWSAVLGLVLLAGAVSYWYEVRERHALAQELEVLTREYRPTQTLLQQLVEMRQRLDDLQRQETVARELEYQRNPLALLGVISQTAQETQGRLRVTKLDLSDFQGDARMARGGNGAGASEAGSSSVVVSGVSLDNPAVADLLEGLQNSGLFGQVELLKMKEREGGSTRLSDYEVMCEL
jgi:Tfp pilus assembly protein PilN